MFETVSRDRMEEKKKLYPYPSPPQHSEVVELLF
jgi:hypothetical protein